MNEMSSKGEYLDCYRYMRNKKRDFRLVMIGTYLRDNHLDMYIAAARSLAARSREFTGWINPVRESHFFAMKKGNSE